MEIFLQALGDEVAEVGAERAIWVGRRQNRRIVVQNSRAYLEIRLAICIWETASGQFNLLKEAQIKSIENIH